MKKSNIILAILLVLSIFILILSFIERKKELEVYDYAKKISFKNDIQLLAVANLNSTAEATSRYVPGLESIKIYQVLNEQEYLIIPRYKNMEISIYEISYDEEEKRLENLIASTNNLFILKSGMEEENVIIKVKYNDVNFEYIPIITEKKLKEDKYVLDITKQ